MPERRSRQVIVAGAGIAGLTAALAFAARGFTVKIFERATELHEVGAGLQLSPNATRILDRLGVLSLLLPAATRPEAVVLRRAADLREIARVPLGDWADRRWRAPYVVVHRADLQAALLACVARQPDIEIALGAPVRDIALYRHGVTVSVDAGPAVREAAGMLCVAADGVWSTVRALAGARARSRFTGQVAWRATRRLEGDDRALSAICAPDVVSAFLHPGFHLIAYPVRAGSAINLAAFTPGAELAEGWSSAPDASPLVAATRDVAGPLAALIASTAAWTAWPIHDVDMEIPWTASSGLALIGDAAHAMTPFAAQGAAMAIEDAETLAASIAAGPDTAASLASWERMRRRRVRRVARRGAFNRFVWHAGGAVAAARDLVLRARRPEKLAADLDWLYGWEPPVSDGGSSSGKAGSPPGVA